MLKYKKIFLNKIKLLLFYFIKFFDDWSMLSKIYSENCIIGIDQKPIIMIIYDKSTFFANND